MARMHSRDKGKAKSHRPVGRPIAAGGLNAKDTEKQVVALAKEGKKPSEIGRILRDEHKTPDVKAVLGKKIAQVIAENDVKYSFPEDMEALLTKAVLIRKHLNANKQDQTARRGLRLTESKVLRLAKHLKRTGAMPANWKYNPQEISYLGE